MLKLNDLQPAKGSKRKTKRLGRGTGSGRGCTAGKGNNGLKARRGASNKLYFEGGQTPLTRRIPKKGFNNIFKKEFQIVNVAELEKLEETDTEINVTFLHEKGLIHEVDRPVKILGNGELNKTFTIKVHAYSKAAREKIENAKGKAEVIDRA